MFVCNCITIFAFYCYYSLTTTSTTRYHGIWYALQVLDGGGMFIRPDERNKEPFQSDFTIINASDVKNHKFKNHGMNSETFVIFHLGRKIAIIGGTEYGGEMKKGIFSVLHYLLPMKGVLSMHCSANVDTTGENTALFFGLSGTGKTTLSTDEKRPLIGDDEHGWSENGIFNFEGGCYAKVIRLNPEEEPGIYNAIRNGALLENVVFDKQNGTVDYDDDSKTENTQWFNFRIDEKYKKKFKSNLLVNFSTKNLSCKSLSIRRSKIN